MGLMKKSLNCENPECNKYCKSSQIVVTKMKDGAIKNLCKECALKIAGTLIIPENNLPKSDPSIDARLNQIHSLLEQILQIIKK